MSPAFAQTFNITADVSHIHNVQGDDSAAVRAAVDAALAPFRELIGTPEGDRDRWVHQEAPVHADVVERVDPLNLAGAARRSESSLEGDTDAVSPVSGEVRPDDAPTVEEHPSHDSLSIDAEAAATAPATPRSRGEATSARLTQVARGPRRRLQGAGAGGVRPYYQDELVTLYHGDCLELIEHWAAAAVLITDPPYGLEGLAGAYGMSQRTILNDKDTTVRDAALAAWGPVRPAAVFGTPRLPDPPGDWAHRLVWDKGQLGLNGGPWRYAHESIFVRGDGWKRVDDTASSILRHPTARNRAHVKKHIHSKPAPLLTELIASAPSGLIADPFAGGGSTVAAALYLGRPIVAVEMDEQHCETIAARCSDRTLDIFGGAE